MTLNKQKGKPVLVPEEKEGRSQPTTMNQPLRILHLEDARFDADLIKRELNKSGLLLEWLWVGNKKEFEQGLNEFKPDIILSDYSLPSFSAEVAFQMTQELTPGTPFIIVSGTIGDENMVKLIENGVTDYASKDRLVTLLPKIIRALKEADVEKEKKAISETLTKIKNLYAFISQVNQNIVRIKDEVTLFRNACKMAVEFGKFKMAWIGLFNFKAKTISVVEQCGLNDQDIVTFTDFIYESEGAQVHVLTTGKHFICNNIETDLALLSWKPLALARGINSVVVLPIKRLGEIIGTLNLYSSEINFSGSEEIKLLIELTNDISFALDLFEKDKILKISEELVVKNEKRFRALIEQSEDMETLASEDGKLFYASPSVKVVLGYELNEFLFIPPQDIIHPDDLMGVFENVQKIAQIPGASFYGQHRLKHKEGRWIYCEGTMTNMLQEPYVNAIVSNFRDVSEKKLIQQKLDFDTNNLNALINNTIDLMWSVDKNFNLITSNTPFNNMAISNFGKLILKGENILSVSYTPEMLNHFKQLYQRVFDGETFTETAHFFQPFEFWTEISYSPIHNGDEIIGAACHSRDITERKKAERGLIKSNRLYAFISAINQSIVHIKEENELLKKACSIAMEIGNFKAAWIGLLNKGGKLEIINFRGESITQKIAEKLSGIDVQNSPFQNTGVGKALRNGIYAVSNDVLSDPDIPFPKEEILSTGIRANAVFPIRKSGKLVGVFSFHSDVVNFFDEAEIALLQEATDDISFALENLERIERHRKAEEIIINNENRFRSIIEKSKDIKMLSNIHGEFIYGSPSVSKLFGYSNEEFLNKSAFTFFHPDDLPHLILNRTAILEVPGGSFSFQYRLLHKNGNWIWCEGTLTNMLQEPGIHAFVSNFRDISDRKLAEQNLALEIRLSKKHQSMLLSSQINPHFIFNALNSVQYFILLKENIELALNFVADFSLLMRKTLTNSRSEFIPIADELKFLNLYLELEQKRSPKKFSFQIITDPEIQSDDLYIPPMLIQPYLENAVIHGVTDEKSNNLILIQFSLISNRIVCKIIDNGIGRKKAMELKNTKLDSNKHESMGMKITETRIKLLNELYDDSFVVDIKDLTDNEGKAKGTEVEITLPILDEGIIFGLDSSAEIN